MSNITNSLIGTWKKLKAEHGLEAAALYIVEYYKEVGVIFPASWDEMQCCQLITTFMETLKIEDGKITNEVNLMGETTPDEVSDVFNALARSEPVIIPEHLLIMPRQKMTFTQMRKLGKRK